MKKWAEGIISLFLTCYAATVSVAAVVPADIKSSPLEMEETKQAGTLVFSDCPEYVQTPGILAEGTIQGKGRIYYYHVNEAAEGARLVVFAESRDGAQIHIGRVLRGDPSQDYFTSGRTLSEREAKTAETKGKDIMLIGGEKKVIADYAPDGIEKEDLATGIVEVEADTPVQFGTALLPPGNDMRAELLHAVKLAPDSHEMRGTFPMERYFRNKKIWNTDTGGPVSFFIGDNKNIHFAKGPDELDGVTRENTGDYGITWFITLRTEGNKNFSLYMMPMGGIFLSSFSVSQDGVAFPYRTDRNRQFGKSGENDFVYAGTWRSGSDIVIRMLVPGASFLPLQFLLLPEDGRSRDKSGHTDSAKVPVKQILNESVHP